MDPSEVLQEALKQIKPTEQDMQKINQVAKEALSIAKSMVKDFDSEIKVVVEGSVAKNTWIKGSGDIDIFFLFPARYKDQGLEKTSLPLLKKIAEKLGPSSVKYAQHPYLKTRFKGVEIELVPGFQSIPPKIISAVDRTPYHTRYVLEHLENPDQARLMKQFCKGVGVYGAEQSSLGFSGYLCELLVIKYGDFLSALENISRWEVGGLIIPDPIDPQRNVAAAVSPEKLSLLVRAAGAFLEYPSIRFFFPNPTPMMKESEISDAIGDKLIYLITMDKSEADPEILHSQLRSFTNDLCKFLDKIGFNCLSSWYDVGDELAILFEVEAANLPAQKLRLGPPSKMKDASDNFKKSCEETDIEPWLVGDRWQAYIPRKFTKLDEAVESWLSELKGPKHVLDVASSFQLVKKNDLISKYSKFSGKLKQFISISLLDLPPWEW